MFGSAIWRTMFTNGYIKGTGKTSAELDLRNQDAVEIFFKKNQITLF